MNKVLLVIGDGMGDASYKRLNGKTPMDIANTPTLDKLTKNGISGMLYPVGEGNIPSSPVAHRAMLGDFSYREHIGRGMFAALSSSLKINKGDIVFRCDLSTFEDGKIIDERAGRINKTEEIQKAINELSPFEGVEFVYQALKEYRGVLLIRKNDRFKGCNVSDLFSMEGTILYMSKANDPESQNLADFINHLFFKVHTLLSDLPEKITHKANAITLRGASEYKQLDNFMLKGKKVKGGFITGIPDVYGALKFCGLSPLVDTTSINIKKISPTQYIDPIINNLDKFDLFVVNIGSFDAAGHDGNIREKVALFEQLDKMIEYFQNMVSDKATIILTADHCTLCRTKQHSFLPVPLVVCNSTEGYDEASAFAEKEIIEHGILGTVKNGTVVAKIIAANLGKGYYIS